MPRPTPAGEPFTRLTPGSQTLARGLDLLRAFLGGAPMLSNAQLAERSGLPRPTVSRLTHSLVAAGYLEHDAASKGYRLAPVCLSFARAFRLGRTEVEAALPLLRKVAVDERVNVALSAADGLEMVHLEAVREARGPLRRTVMAGTRFAIESSSVGHAYLAALPDAQRKRLLARLAKRCGASWPQHKANIAASLAQQARQGYCRPPTLPGALAMATPVPGPFGVIYAVTLNFSTSVDSEFGPMETRLAPVLRTLAAAIEAAWVDFSIE